ncbi:MAG: glycosyltransferase [Candidatus Gastranaerophilales bacterium]|nr:glycosyltransferase [Candidatus Gastranaerophilales bacterium]
MNNKIIPVMHCFDDNYALPASVSFYSMLDNADKNYNYKLYVLHTDITQENQKKLQETIAPFLNATLEFINMENKFDNLWKNLNIKGHYSKEMFYKFLPASIFPQYEKIIITDVDVVWLGDISKTYIDFDVNEDFYFAGCKGALKKNSWVYQCVKSNYEKNFSEEEQSQILVSAGYYIFNLSKMRRDNMGENFIDCATKNAYRIMQPEQDVINLCCYPKIKLMPLNSVVCTYVYDLYKTDEDFENDLIHTAQDIKDAMQHPI